ncbi:MAG TPA: ATP-binding protein [Anaerolineaceae bacterium]|nr:ATP-binding protein [Anaerolineaceae bacterium]
MVKPSSYPTRIQRYQRLIEISRDLASILDLDVLLKRIVSVAAELSNAQEASILLYDESSYQLYFQAATNMDESMMRGISVPLEGSIAGWIITNRKPVIVSDVHRDPRYFGNVEEATQFMTSSLIGVPLINKDRVLGVLEVLNKKEGQFFTEDEDILMVLAYQAAVAIDNARLFQQSDLIAELVHELRTPLASLNTASYLLLRPEISEQQRHKLATTIHSETQRLNDMASSYLDLARLESGRAAFHPALFDLSLLIDECRGVIQTRAEEAHLTIQIDLAPGLPRIEADRDKIKQVLLNLLSNAVKYNRPQGNVTIQAHSMEKEIVLVVKDTGIGIPPDELPHLFEKFFRTRGAERVASGTGLGLSICKHIIDSHGGRIEVQSKINEGTTISITLPLRQS